MQSRASVVTWAGTWIPTPTTVSEPRVTSFFCGGEPRARPCTPQEEAPSLGPRPDPPHALRAESPGERCRGRRGASDDDRLGLTRRALAPCLCRTFRARAGPR